LISPANTSSASSNSPTFFPPRFTTLMFAIVLLSLRPRSMPRAKLCLAGGHLSDRLA
jgi:hypothetical protein